MLFILLRYTVITGLGSTSVGIIMDKNILSLVTTKNYYNIFFKLLPYIIFLLIWQFSIIFFKVPTFFIPSPLEIFNYMIRYKSLLFLHSSITTLEALLGILLSIKVTLILGIITIYCSFLIKLFYKILLIIQIIPLMSIAPLIVIWLGFSIVTKVFIVFIICLFPCLVSFLASSLQTNKDILLFFQSMGASKWQIFKLVIFPSSCYGLFSGLKIAVTYSVTGAVIAEYLGAEKGIGVYLARSLSSFNNPAIFANIFCLIFITLSFYKIVVLVEKFFNLTHYDKRVKL